jgi:ADP-heptose:LPS heptosyltransferase
MRALFFSMLRMGDLVMMAPAIKRWRDLHPHARVDVVINDSSMIATELFPFVDNFLVFPRLNLQHTLVQRERGLFESHDFLQKFIQQLVDRKYTHVFNLTQNRLCGYFMPHFLATERNGMELGTNGVVRFGSPWFRYLNDFQGMNGGPKFHFNEIFQRAVTNTCDGKLPLDLFDDLKTKESRDLNAILKKGAPSLLIQPISSEENKNWPLEMWNRLVEHLKLTPMGRHMVLLCAPEDRIRLESALDESIRRIVTIASLPLSHLVELFRFSPHLLSVDTGIKHLASATQCRVIELSMGHSDAQQTGAYGNGHVVLQQDTTNKKSEERNFEDEVRQVADILLHMDEPKKSSPLGPFVLMKTHILASGDYVLDPIHKTVEQTDAMLSGIFEREAWRAHLENVAKSGLTDLGWRAQKIFDSLVAGWGSDFVENQVSDFLLRNEKTAEKSSTANGLKHEKLIEDIRIKWQLGGYDFIDEKKSPLANLREVRQADTVLRAIKKQSEFKTKLFSNLRTHIEESL